eukprot:7882336-Lingulodinium_polyedra.AAC.1
MRRSPSARRGAHRHRRCRGWLGQGSARRAAGLQLQAQDPGDPPGARRRLACSDGFLLLRARGGRHRRA